MDISGLSGPIVSVLTAASALPIAQFLQRGREFRLRRSIEANMKIASELADSKLENADRLRNKIEDVLSRQFDALGRLQEESLSGKLRNYPTLAASLVIAAMLTIPMWIMWKPEHWWSWTGFVTLGLGAILMLIGGFNACFNQDLNRKRLEKLAVE